MVLIPCVEVNSIYLWKIFAQFNGGLKAQPKVHSFDLHGFI